MGSAAETAAAVGISLVFFDFGVFFGGSVTFDAGPVTSLAGLVAFLCPSLGTRKFTARPTDSLRPSGGDSRTNRLQTLGDPFGVNRAEFGRASWGSVKAVLSGVLGLKHLVDPFSIGRGAKVARR